MKNMILNINRIFQTAEMRYINFNASFKQEIFIDGKSMKDLNKEPTEMILRTGLSML